MIGERADEAPDLIQAIVGYRSWKPTEDLKRLQGTAIPVEWEPEMKAECHPFRVKDRERPEHTAPDPACSCGLYSWYDTARYSTGPVRGAVVMWGRVQVHEGGMRAERARMVCLVCDDRALDTLGVIGLARLAHHYGVPLVTGEQLEAIALEHGLPIPAAFRKAAREKTEAARAARAKAAAKNSIRREGLVEKLDRLFRDAWKWRV